MTHNSLQLINPWPSNSGSNWNLEILVFEDGGKPENPEKNPRSKGENQNKLNQNITPGPEKKTYQLTYARNSQTRPTEPSAQTPEYDIIDIE